MRVTFLGTSGAVPTTDRNPSAIAVERAGDRLLFDCGEGTQRQMMRYGTGFAVGHIFLTHLHGDHVLGLPGLLQTWDFNDRESPLAIHAPAGTRQQVKSLVAAAGDRPEFPVRINQVTPGTVALERDAYAVRAFDVDHRTTAVGYVLVEDDRRGRFDREHAEDDLGIPPGPKYSKLHAGESIEHDGRTVHPEEVVGSPRPGRRLVYTGDTRPAESVVEAAADADLLIHDGTFGDDLADRAAETAHSTASEAAQIANDAGARRLVLTHVSSRYAGDVNRLDAAVDDAFDGELALVAADGLAIDVPFPDDDDGATVEWLDG